MKRLKTIPCAVLFFLVISASMYCSTADCANLTAEMQDDMIIVRIDGVTFTSYRYSAGQKYPYFYPVNGPLSGVSVTTESSLPYPHHRSLFFGLDRVNGGNYWQEGNNRGQIISHGPRIVENGPDTVVINDECAWKQPNEKPIIIDTRTIIITAPCDSLRTIDFSITLTAQVDIHVEKSNHSLFSARMDDRLSVLKGGTLVNASGGKNQEGTLGKNSPWCDYYGSRFGYVEGLAIFDSPGNLWYPSTWLTRDYGFFSPTPMNWLDEKGFSLKKGESLELRYCVIVHAGDTIRSGIDKHFEEWSKSIKR